MLNEKTKEDLKTLDNDSTASQKLDEIRYRIERQLVKNWVIFALVFFVLVFLGIREVKQLRVEMARMAHAQEIGSKSAIAIDNGVVLDIKQNIIKPKDYQNAIATTLVNLVVSRAEVSKKFTQTKFDNVGQLLENSEKLANFFNEFILVYQKDDMPEYVEFEKKGVGYFKAYLDTLNQLFIEDRLPHVVDILDYRIPKDKFSSDGKVFQITVEVPIAFATWNKEKKGWGAMREGTVTIQAKGVLDIKTRTKEDRTLQTKGLNGMGIHFEWFNVIYPEIKEGY